MSSRDFATQVILTARLTRLYERRDWQTRFAAAKDVEPLRLERGITLDLKPVTVPEPAPTATPGPDRAMMERSFARVKQMESIHVAVYAPGSDEGSAPGASSRRTGEMRWH